LPPELPSTFTSKICHIFYFLQASCATWERILAKKRVDVLIQGTSYVHRENAAQVRAVEARGGTEEGEFLEAQEQGEVVRG
jgi:hypothetical protein